MSMSTHLIGFKPIDETFNKMHRVLCACRDAAVNPPDEVKQYFGNDWEFVGADDKGVRVDLTPTTTRNAGVAGWRDDDREGFEVDLRQLDPSIKILRFYNSW